MKFSVVGGVFTYSGAARALLDNVSFEVNSGEVVAVLGPNGAGKTTLLRCMLGFLRWQRGGSFLNGRDIRQIPPRELFKRIAFVPQAREAGGFGTAQETVLLGRGSRLQLFSQPGKADYESVEKSLERLGIAHLKKRRLESLSGGERQLVLIARALAAEPELLVLDEPESNLDFKNQLVILNTISELSGGGIACVFNTHYPAHALRRADKALLLDKCGRHVFGGTGSVVTENNLASAFSVRAVIGEVETKHEILRDVLPIEILPDGECIPPDRSENEIMKGENDMETRIAIISIIVEQRENTEQINAALHEYAEYIIGRMGMPYPKKGMSIICVILDAPETVASALSGKLGMIKGISVKTTYSKR